MVYLQLNGLIVEGETVTEIHMKAEIKRYPRRCVHQSRPAVKESDVITEIVNEIYKKIKE